MCAQTHWGETPRCVKISPNWVTWPVRRVAAVNWWRMLALAFNIGVWSLLIVLGRIVLGKK
jgi:hypothetical protein